MRRNILNYMSVITLIFLSSCDQAYYEGKDEYELLSMADKMTLSDSYEFYVKVYRNTSPPMLTPAETFRRFGKNGTNYIFNKAKITEDREEFEAATDALLILSFKCDVQQLKILTQKADMLNVDQSDVQYACGIPVEFP